jgi:hypothetical protein
VAFYREYRNPGEFVQQAVSQLPGTEKVPPAVAKLPTLFAQEPLAQLSWRQNLTLCPQTRQTR